MATELIGIELRLLGAEGVYNDMKELDTLVRRLGGRHKIEFELGQARQKILELNGEINQTNREIDKSKAKVNELNKALNGMKEGDEGFEELKEAASKANEELKEHQEHLKAVKNEMKDTRQEANELSNALNRVKSLKQVFNDWSLGVARFGSALQSAGNALTRFSAPVRMLMSGAILGAGYSALNTATEGLSAGFERYDIMHKFPRVMKIFGYSAEEAKKARDELEQSVLGLPTGLDEMINLTQRYTATTGDLQKSTQLAIATNNAFLASMSTEEQKYRGMMQLQDIIGGKELKPIEWNSLAKSMPAAFRMIGEALGHSGEELNAWVAEAQAGKVANEEFIEGLLKAGTDPNGKMRQAVEESKNTWQAFFANTRIAFSRMAVGIIESVDSIVATLDLKDKNGKTIESLNGLLIDRVIPAINKGAEAVKGWIEANPDKILDFFNSLKSIDWKGILTGFAQGLGDLAGSIKKFADVASGLNLSWLGKLFSKSGAWGWFLTVSGGLFKGTRHIWAGIGTAITALVRHFTAGKLKGGIFGKILSIFGKKKDMEDAGDVAKTIPTVADTFKSAFKSLEGLIKASGAILLVSGTGFAAFKAARSILTDLKAMVDLVNGGGWDNVGYVASGVIVAIGAFTEIFNAIGTALGPQGLLGVAIASAASMLVTGSFASDMWLIKSGLQNIRDTILEFDEIGDAITNMKGLAGISTGDGSKLKTSVDAIREIARTLNGGGGGPIDRGQPSGGIPLFTSFRANSLANIAGAIEQLKNVVTQFNQLGAMRIVNNPATVIDSIKQACDRLQGIRGPKNIDKHAQKVANALVQIRRMAYHINKLAGTTVNTNGFAGFVAEIKSALGSLEELNGELMLDIEVKLSPLFGSSVEGVKTNIKNAKRDIEKMKSPIRFTIPVYVTFSVTTNLSAALAKIRGDRQILRSAGNGGGSSGATPNASQKHGGASEFAIGGLVYRAHGGSIFKPRGTDTVPAMLTPGEYVHNRKAVNTFGIDFMRKVNNLDMKGAMNELMHRAGHMANINRGTTITNNYNNNQKVVINNSNAGAGYTFKTASRFVGAF